MLNSVLLRDYMDRFFGYGNLSSGTWFVGMEEGGGNSEREIAQRLKRWDELGRETVVDNAQFHAMVQDERGEAMSYHFEGKRKIQRTWAGLIRILLAMQGRTDDSAESVRSMQAEDWGRTESENCLLELLPLPSPGIGQWNYDEWSSLPELRTREVYRQHVADVRIRALRALIQRHAPRSVVFYSVSPDYLSRWSEIANVKFETVEPREVCMDNQGQQFTARFHSNGPTLYTAIYHPVYTGLTKEYFRRVGQLIREETA